jgi:hypothetical protein
MWDQQYSKEYSSHSIPLNLNFLQLIALLDEPELIESIAIWLNESHRKNARMFDQNVVVQCCSNGFNKKTATIHSVRSWILGSCRRRFDRKTSSPRKEDTNDRHASCCRAIEFGSAFSNLHFGVYLHDRPWSMKPLTPRYISPCNGEIKIRRCTTRPAFIDSMFWYILWIPYVYSSTVDRLIRG